MTDLLTTIINGVLYANLLGLLAGGLFAVLALLLKRRKGGAYKINK